MRNKIFLVIGVFLAIGLMWLKLSSNQKKANKEIQIEKEPLPFAVEVISVQQLTFSPKSSYSGLVEVVGVVNVASETDGRVVRLNIQHGSSVVKGQVIAVLDNKLKTSATQIHELDYKKAKADYQRYAELYRQNNATGVEVETARYAMETAAKQLTLSQSEIGKSTIVAPVSGVVASKAISEGDYLSTGSSVAVIVPLSQLVIRATVPEMEIINIKKGQKVAFDADAYPGHKFEGIVNAIIPNANQAKSFPIIIKVNNNQNGIILMGGMTVNVTMKDKQKSTALVIPRIAVRGDFKDPFVWVVNGEQKAVRRKFKIGRELEDKVEILSGLKSGELVVTKGQENITEGIVLQSLKVVDNKTN